MEQIKLFIEKAKTDIELMSKFNTLGESGAGIDEFIALASEHGFTFTEEDYNKSLLEFEKEELVKVTATQNRYDPKVCPNLKRTRYECVGFLRLFWCDHYRREMTAFPRHKHTCVKGAFDYVGLDDGFPVDKCYFVHKKGGKIIKRPDGKYEAECDSVCNPYRFPGYVVECLCHGREFCKDRRHIVTENGSPLPKIDHKDWYE
jgi:predicted ribosomally synthesized peptide with nif11-like leader